MPAWGEQMWTLHGVSECACVYMCVQQMSCVLFCSPDWLVFVAAPSCRWARPRASLSARTSRASAALICQSLRPSPAPNTTHSLTGSAPSLDDAVLLTHTYHAPFPSLTHTCSVSAVPRTRLAKLSWKTPPRPCMQNISSSRFLPHFKCFLTSSTSIQGQQLFLGRNTPEGMQQEEKQQCVRCWYMIK